MRRLTEEDLGEQAHVSPDDKVFYLREWESGGFEKSDTNQLIKNLQIGVLKKTSNPQEWNYKGRAIRQSAKELDAVLVRVKGIDKYTVVPIPCSKRSDHQEYDDRMLQVANQCEVFTDVRPLIVQTVNREKAKAGARLLPPQHIRNWEIDENFCTPEPTHILILDDVIVAGAQFKAAQKMLEVRFPSAKVRGIFIARRVFRQADATDDFDCLS